MLRNVLENYIDNIKEREFDLPFLALLPQLGFYDIHYTHGQVEFGKDFIAKKIVDEKPVQFSFQCKAGDISQSDWRNNIMGQMLEANINSLSHPNFEKSLEHQSVLVVTGRLLGNVAISLQEFNEKLEKNYRKIPIILWDREFLLQSLEDKGFASLHNSSPSSFVTFGNFYVLYGSIINGKINLQEIEPHFSNWSIENIEPTSKILGITIESEVLAQKAKSKGFLYESTHIYLSLLRSVLIEISNSTSTENKDYLLKVYKQIREKIKNEFFEYFNVINKDWQSVNKEEARLVNGIENIITYPVNCLRIIENISLLYFLEEDTKKQEYILSFLKEFAEKEKGITHIPSDNYAVSLILPIIIFRKNGFEELAKNILKESAIWLCDMYEKELGLAPFGSSVQEEVNYLLGSSFEIIDLQKNNESFFATVLLDLLAIMNFHPLYEIAVNDIKATSILPQYWQIPDTKSLYFIEGEDIISYPNIDYNENTESIKNLTYADHIIHELENYKILSDTDPLSLFMIMLLLRDRYFPKLWKLLM